LLIRITGLPSDLTPKVTVSGQAGQTRTLYATGTVPFAGFNGIGGIDASYVENDDDIVHTVYVPRVSRPQSVCSDTGGIIDVSYVANPASGKLWLAGDTDVAFRAADLTLSGSPNAKVITGKATGGIAFDDLGTLWGLGATPADPTIVSYPPEAFRSSGDKPPDHEIYVQGTGCTPATHSLAFDATGDLWLSQPCEKRVVRLFGSAFTGTTADAPYVPSTYAITDLSSPRGLAFDSAGKLWVANGPDGLVRVDAIQGEVDARFTVMQGSSVEAVAFDDSGSIWVAGGSASTFQVASLVSMDLLEADGGTPATSVRINLGPDAQPKGMAFDESGGLWIAGAPTPDALARLSPSQLKVSTTSAAPTTPERVLHSADVTTAGFPAFYPAPRGAPLFSAHRAP